MKEERIDSKEEFSILKRAQSFSHAGRGLRLFIVTTHNAWIQISIMLLAFVLGLLLEITQLEWVLLVLACGMVLASEALNTAIEIDIDLTSPEYHPYARDTKDVAAGAVLITSLTAFVVGAIIFVPYLL
jgi:diacylglycerol kinase (ATP)